MTLLHTIYSDGNAKRICWSIKTDQNAVDQFREQADIYLNKITNLQSKYIALHVAIFWGIGVFIIKNGDTVRILLDSDEMMTHLTSDERSSDVLIEGKKGFINQLGTMRSLKFEFEKIDQSQNISSKML